MSDPHSQARQTRRPCEVHATHKPTSHVNEIHHIWPKGAGGPDILANEVVVCATGHNSIHNLINEWLKAGAEPLWDVQRHYSRTERYLARLGYERIKRQAM